MKTISIQQANLFAVLFPLICLLIVISPELLNQADKFTKGVVALTSHPMRIQEVQFVGSKASVKFRWFGLVFRREFDIE